MNHILPKTVTIALVSALVITNAMWLYRAIDSAVTIDHHATEVKRQRARVELLSSLLIDYPRELDVLAASDYIRRRYPNEIINVRGDTLEVADVQFLYKDKKLYRVKGF